MWRRLTGARALIDAGADAVKIGIGPGSICTTRVVAGVGVPQFTAVLETAAACREARGAGDRGRRGSGRRGDIVKAIGAGADVVMMGSACWRGRTRRRARCSCIRGGRYKILSGDGQPGSDGAGVGGPVFPAGSEATRSSWCRKGSRGGLAYRGPAAAVIHQMVGGLRAGMGYTGSATVGGSAKPNCSVSADYRGGTAGRATCMMWRSRARRRIIGRRAR